MGGLYCFQQFSGYSVTPGFNGVRVAQSFVLCLTICRLIFVLLSFLFWPLCCLSFFDLNFNVNLLRSWRFTGYSVTYHCTDGSKQDNTFDLSQVTDKLH
jgi:hypothetical protein